MADALGRIADELGGGGGALAVDGLGPAGPWRVGPVGGRGEAEDVGPLLELLVVFLEGKREIRRQRLSRLFACGERECVACLQFW